jgi:hypothetical protein
VKNVLKVIALLEQNSKKRKKWQVLRFILSTNIYKYAQCFFSGEAAKEIQYGGEEQEEQ